MHLPRANPPWEEREIVLLPDPPVLGQSGQICADLQNPMPFPRTVNLEFSVAAFGAGIGFTPVGALNRCHLAGQQPRPAAASTGRPLPSRRQPAPLYLNCGYRSPASRISSASVTWT